MDTTSAGPQRITGPADLLQAVPYLLGFIPEHSLVLVGMHDGMLVVTARLDLPSADCPDDDADAQLANTVDAMARAGVSSIIAAVYTDSARELRPEAAVRRWSALAVAVRAHAAVSGCGVPDVLLAAAGRWRSVGCRDPWCCPPTGRPLPTEPSPFATAATVAGVVALPDRRALEAVLDAAPEPVRAAVARAIATAHDDATPERSDRRNDTGRDSRGANRDRAVKRAMFAAARTSHAPRWPGCSDDDVARFAVALAGPAVRDALWLAVDDRRLDGRPLWRELARRAPAPYDAAPSFLFGWAAWRAGDGASANIAAQRAVDSDPTFSPADLLLAALSQGLDPRTFPRLRLSPD
jgi:Domain of unknown function (DUF4192)